MMKRRNSLDSWASLSIQEINRTKTQIRRASIWVMCQKTTRYSKKVAMRRKKKNRKFRILKLITLQTWICYKQLKTKIKMPKPKLLRKRTHLIYLWMINHQARWWRQNLKSKSLMRNLKTLLNSLPMRTVLLKLWQPNNPLKYNSNQARMR